MGLRVYNVSLSRDGKWINLFSEMDRFDTHKTAIDHK